MTGRFSTKSSCKFYIIIVESEPDDVAPFIESFRATDRTNDVHVVSKGDTALDFLHKRGPYTDASRPDLVLLDLHIPGPSGEEILVELTEQPELRRIPVLVVTTSDAEEDVARSYELNANAYLQKPATADEFVELAQAIEEFWLKVVELPPK